jgi:hypothetical protein
MSAIKVDEVDEAAIRTGNLIKNITQDNTEGKYCRAYSRDGRFLGILTRDKDSGNWRPKKVFI